MNWQLLKNFQCPKCGATLKDGVLYKCIGCDFMISKGKFVEITLNKKVPTLNKRANKLLIKQKLLKKILHPNKGIWHIPDNF